MTSLQTKALVVTPIRGDKLDFSHRIVWLVRRECSDMAENFFLAKTSSPSEKYGENHYKGSH